MALNVGITPPDFNTPVGQFRLLANDLVYEDIEPASPGLGQYQLFADAEISAFVSLSGTSLLRAVGTGYIALAARAATESSIVKDYDLQADLTKKATDLRLVAQAYFDRADAQNVLTGENSTFDLTGGQLAPDFGYTKVWPLDFWDNNDLEYVTTGNGPGAPGFGNGGYGE